MDILGDASPERYAQALTIAAADENSDGLLVVLTPQAMTDPTRTAEALTAAARTAASRSRELDGRRRRGGRSTVLAQADIPTFPYPDTAARIFTHMWRYSDNLRALYETPSVASDPPATPSSAEQRSRPNPHRSPGRGRTLLTEFESKQVLAAYTIPPSRRGSRRRQTRRLPRAEAMGYPVVLKLHSETITHKTDVGGVALNLDRAAVRRAYRRIRVTVTARRARSISSASPCSRWSRRWLRADCRRSSTPSSGRCSCSDRAASSSRSIGTARSRCRRSTRRSRGG